MQAIIDACKEGCLNARVCMVISNNSGSLVLERARREGIPSYHLSEKTHPRPEELDRAILHALEEHKVNLVLLAGYMKKLGPQTISRYRGHILNTHPALLPKFGGKGMYGESVHEAILAAGERVSGVTIHQVDEEYDHGPIVAQCEVPILDDDTVDSLRKRVQKCEHSFLVEILQQIAQGQIDLAKVVDTRS